MEVVKWKKRWESYEQVAADLLNRFAQEFAVDFFEGKQVVQGLRSATMWEIDAKGVKSQDGGFIIVDCKRWKDRQPQSIIGSLAYSIIDAGAVGGIIVSPLGLQEGAKKVAAAENIFEVRLDENSTRQDFVMSFLNRFMVGVSSRANFAAVATCTIQKAADPRSWSITMLGNCS